MFADFESCISIDLPQVQFDLSHEIWIQYNPRKAINRYGLSLTSLDGGTSGVPDLDSIFEYNKINNSDHREKDFNQPTQLFLKYFGFLPDHFDIGRSHIIRLGSGGFFPYHRDLDPDTFRLIYTISGCENRNFTWLQNGQILNIENNKWYCINTRHPHAVFSFFGSEFAVFNLIKNQRSENSIFRLLTIK